MAKTVWMPLTTLGPESAPRTATWPHLSFCLQFRALVVLYLKMKMLRLLSSGPGSKHGSKLRCT
eukprot:1747699-Amphidinium_carterae.1